MKKKLIILGIVLLIIILGGLLMINIFGKKYSVYINGKEKKHFPGSTVKMKLEFVTDATYHITIKEKDINLKHKTRKNYTINYFKMPKHDVHITKELRNDMRRIRNIVNYSERVIDATENSNYCYINYDDDKHIDISTNEENKTYIAKENLENEINKIIEKYDIKNWDKETNYDALDGIQYTIIFELENFDTITISSDKIPEGKEGIFKEIKNVLLNNK